MTAKQLQNPRSNYFFVMFCIYLFIVFLGFAQSFYLKFLVPEQPFYPRGLPTSHVIHGLILTVWYVFLVLQSGWIRYQKVRIHRKMGWFGGFWAVLVLVSSLWVISIFPDRIAELAKDMGKTVEEVEPGLPLILWLDVFMCLLFVVFVTLGIAYRNKPEFHKRLMLYSGLAFLFAAIGRIGGTLTMLAGMDIGMPVGILLLLGLSISQLVYDYRRMKKVFPISWICFGLYWLAIVLSIIIGGSEFGMWILA